MLERTRGLRLRFISYVVGGAPLSVTLGHDHLPLRSLSDMTEKQLRQIEARAAKATPGPWYAHATDDMYASNALYISVEPGSIDHHDNRHGMEEGNWKQADPGGVVAITLLQSPLLACVKSREWDENSVFIAHARTDIPLLAAEVRRLRMRVDGLRRSLKER